MKKIAPLTLAFILAIVALQALQAKDCKSACEKFVSCTAQTHKKNPTPEQHKQLMGGCMQSCARHTKAVLACYAKSSNSCNAYGQCIYSAQKNK